MTRPDLDALRERLTELASDLDGTFAKLPEAVQKEYREAEQSVVDARRRAPALVGHLWITS